VRRTALFSICLVFLFGPLVTAANYNVVLLEASEFEETQGLSISGNTQVGLARNQAGPEHAYLWNGTTESGVDLHPAAFVYSAAFDVAGDQQVGHGYLRLSEPYSQQHALLWNGSAETAIDLHPGVAEQYDASQAVGTSGVAQVGWASNSGISHAMLWHGTADSATNLNASEFFSSRAHGISGSDYIGSANYLTGSAHAILWHGSVDNYVDLNPPGYIYSVGVNISGSTQVGGGIPVPGSLHALLWRGTAESFVDLHPPGYSISNAVGLAGNIQVGFGRPVSSQFFNHALLWEGSAESVVDLHSFLPSDFSESEASDVSENGVIIGTALRAGHRYSVLWTPVPEPRTFTLVLLAIFLTCLRRSARTTGECCIAIWRN
jgi:hypothetical protein